MCFTFIMKDTNHECIEATAGGTTKGGLESADIWGDADDVSQLLFNHSKKIELTNYLLCSP